MKIYSKYTRYIKFLYHNRRRVKELQKVVEQEFKNVKFIFSSIGGADLNYFLLKDHKRFGMFRLTILDYVVDKGVPLQRFEKNKRLEKEYQAYNLGHSVGLTPKVLFRFDDGLVCEYLDGYRVFDILQKDKSKVWDILSDAAKTYSKLHVLEITHLDATLKNFIFVDGQMKVIDFEYYPSEYLSIEVQKAYDYVRIIEHTLRIIPMKYQKDYDKFIDVLDEIVPKELRDVDFKLVEQWLKNIDKYPIYLTLKKRIFTKLEF